MRENRDELIIQAAPEGVWGILTDLEKHKEWNPLIYHATGKLEIGEIVILSAKAGSIDMKYKCKVVNVETTREIKWVWHIGSPFLLKGEHTFILEQANPKSTRLVNSEIFKGLLVPFLTKFLTTAGKDGMLAMDRGLKDRAEGLKIS